MVQQSHEDPLSLDLVEILNVFSENRKDSSLNISLKEVLAANIVDKTTVISDEIGRVPES